MTDAVKTDMAPHEKKVVSLPPYILLGLLALGLALMARAPASLLQHALPAGTPLKVHAWGGTLWQGQAELQLGGGASFLSWQLVPGSLLTGRIAADVQGRGDVAFSAQAEQGVSDWALRDVRGEIPSSAWQALLPPGWSLPGSIRADALTLSRRGHGTGPWRAAGGRLFWAGGPMQYRIDNQSQTATLPPSIVDLRLEGDTLVLAFQEEAGHLGLALLRLEPNGEIEVRLRERLLRYTPSYRSSGGDADAVVVTARQQG